MHTVDVSRVGHSVVLNPSIGPNSTDCTASRAFLDLDALHKLAVHGVAPLVKGETLVDASAGKPGATTIFA